MMNTRARTSSAINENNRKEGGIYHPEQPHVTPFINGGELGRGIINNM